MANKLRKEVSCHPDFLEYMECMVAHPNYTGLFYERNKDGKIRWVVTGKSAKGKMRKAWWIKKCQELGIPLRKGCYAKAAQSIHPTGLHVCQCCGEAKSVFYEYPNRNTVVVLNRILGTDIDKDRDSDRVQFTIREIVEGWCDTMEKAKALALAFELPEPKNVENLVDLIYERLVANDSHRFSPGVMSNPPDRFDGYHSYGLCCRTLFDTGRQADNMKTYGQDRRAYEEWADGNYRLANRLMGEFRKQKPMRCPECNNIRKMSADHIGPISLGFCHSRNFAPMCGPCNSAKNNRFTKRDVDMLLNIEASGEPVISWHSKHIWDRLKHNIHNDADAKAASSVMAKCHQNVLNIFSIIYRLSGTEYLSRFLHPDYSLRNYKFENVDLMHLDNIKIIESPLYSQNAMKNRERYIRIAFERLEQFAQKDNRKNDLKVDENHPALGDLVRSIQDVDYAAADEQLSQLIATVADEILYEELDQ